MRTHSTLAAMGFAGICIAGSLALSLPAAAGTLASSTVTPNSTRVGSTVQLRVVAGAPACGIRIEPGDGRVLDRAVNGSKDFPLRYDDAGSYSVKVTGRKKGNKPACKGGVAPVGVEVEEAFLRKKQKATSSVIRRMPLKAPKAPGGNNMGSSRSPDEARSPLPEVKRPSCAEFPCVTSVDVTPAGDSAQFDVLANKIHAVEILVGLSKPVGSKWSSQMPGPKLVATTNVFRNPSRVNFQSLQPDQDYWYLVKVIDEDDRASFHSGAFSTKGRRVRVTLVRAHANDDGDDTSAGDFKFRIFANGKERIYAHADISTGTSVDFGAPDCLPACAFTIDSAPPELDLGIGVNEDDSLGLYGPAFQFGGWQYQETASTDAPGTRTIVRQIAADDFNVLVTLEIEVTHE